MDTHSHGDTTKPGIVYGMMTFTIEGLKSIASKYERRCATEDGKKYLRELLADYRTKAIDFHLESFILVGSFYEGDVMMLQVAILCSRAYCVQHGTYWHVADLTSIAEVFTTVNDSEMKILREIMERIG